MSGGAVPRPHRPKIASSSCPVAPLSADQLPTGVSTCSPTQGQTIRKNTPISSPAIAIRIGTNRRPPKNASQGTSFTRWYRCQRIAAVSPMVFPPSTPGTAEVSRSLVSDV